MIKPKLRKGYYLSRNTEGGFEYSKLTLDTPTELGIPILKGPSFLGESGFVVISSKQVYEVTQHDLFNSFIRAASSVGIEYIKSNFERYYPGMPTGHTEPSSEGTGGGGVDQSDNIAGFEDELKSADEVIKNQVQVLFGQENT